MVFFKLCHLIFLFTWIGTLLSLSRLSGYLSGEKQEFRDRFLHMYRKVYLMVDLPSMLLALCFGGIVLSGKPPSIFKAGWFHMKMTCAFFLIVADLSFGRALLKSKKSLPKNSGLKFKLLHGMMGFLLIGVLTSIYLVKHLEKERGELAKSKRSDNSVGEKVVSLYDATFLKNL